jgi:hypothetical protein
MRSELADFVIVEGMSVQSGGPLTNWKRVLDNRGLLPRITIQRAVFDASDPGRYNDGLRHSAPSMP